MERGYTTYTSNQATDTTSTVDFANVSIGANGDIDFVSKLDRKKCKNSISWQSTLPSISRQCIYKKLIW